MSMSPSHSAAVAIALLAFCCPAATAAGDAVSARRPLRGNETVVSAQGKFELGLFSPNGSGGRLYLGIWYKNIPVQTVIWVGNRASPLTEAASAELRVSSDTGNLELAGPAGVVWSSNLSSSPPPSPSSNVAVLRDNGNLVLVDGNNASSVLWQSFDHPTDTLVPEAWLGENKLTREYQALTSWRSAADPAPGMFTDTVDPTNATSSEFLYLWNGSRPYWRSGVWTGRVFANLPEAVHNVLFNQTYADTREYRRVTSVLYDNATLTRMVMDLTGQTKQYIWVPGSASWSLFWAAPTVQCDVYALCGAFGVCDPRSQPPCQCPPRFAPAAEREWGLGDWSAGCRRNAPLRCAAGATADDGFVEMQNMKPPFSPDESVVTSARSRAECESVCLNNCSCQAYAFSGDGGCAVWTGDVLNLQQLLADSGGGSSPPPISLYIRLSRSELQQHLRDESSKRKIGGPVAVAGVVVAAALLVASALLVAWIIQSRRRRSVRAQQKAGNNHKGACSALRVYSYGDLRAATKNFSDRLGGGGFGSVYRGVVVADDNNGGTATTMEVAVKKMEGLRQGDKQFRAEVNTLGLIQHVNLVRLLGFCCSPDGHHKLLVYEYMPNGSLDAFLFRSRSSSPSLPWRDRYAIMLGVARGLAYLHEGCRDRIIHCDIKPENVLLDADLRPKIADFGMAKLVGRDFSRVLTTMRGTIGYLAPEWISGLPIGAKADVYSFGMLLFELISGRRNADQASACFSGGGVLQAADDNDEEEEAEGGGRQRASSATTFFPVWAAARVAEGNTADVADAGLRGDVSEEELVRACRVACWCIQDQEAHRPTMPQVAQALEGVVDVHLPPMPRALQRLASLA